MGNSSSKKLIVEKRHIPELIVSGFIRERTLELSVSLSVDIQRLCLLFYYQEWYLFLTVGSDASIQEDSNNYNGIQCLDMKSLDTFDFTLHDLHDLNGPSPFQSEDFDKMFYGECLHRNVFLPQWVLPRIDSDEHPLDRHRRYNMLYRIGGAFGKNGRLSKTSNCIIYDPLQFQRQSQCSQIDGYCIGLPQIKVPLTSATAVIDQGKECLYVIGREQFGKPLIQELRVNENELEWIIHKDLRTEKRFGVALTMIPKYGNGNSDSMVLMCGGRNIERKMQNTVNIIDMELHSVIDLSPMIHERAYFKCVAIREGERYIVGGGYEGCRDLEILDLEKGKWSEVAQKTNYVHEWNSKLWVDHCDENVVYLCGKRIGFDGLAELGYIEFCDLREGTNMFSVLGQKNIAGLFGIKSRKVSNKWMPRSIFI